MMSTGFEKDVDAYYHDKESYTKLLFDPSTRNIPDVDEKKKVNSINEWEGSRSWFQRQKPEPAPPTSKADFEALFDGKSVAEIQSGVESMHKENSTGKKTMPTLTKR